MEEVRSSEELVTSINQAREGRITCFELPPDMVVLKWLSMSFDNTKKINTVESRLCVGVMGLPEKEALSLIERAGRIGFVEKRDRETFEPKIPTGHSYRVRLTIRNGKVVSTSVG